MSQTDSGVVLVRWLLLASMAVSGTCVAEGATEPFYGVQHRVTRPVTIIESTLDSAMSELARQLDRPMGFRLGRDDEFGATNEVVAMDGTVEEILAAIAPQHAWLVSDEEGVLVVSTARALAGDRDPLELVLPRLELTCINFEDAMSELYGDIGLLMVASGLAPRQFCQSFGPDFDRYADGPEVVLEQARVTVRSVLNRLVRDANGYWIHSTHLMGSPEEVCDQLKAGVNDRTLEAVPITDLLAPIGNDDDCHSAGVLYSGIGAKINAYSSELACRAARGDDALAQALRPVWLGVAERRDWEMLDRVEGAVRILASRDSEFGDFLVGRYPKLSLRVREWFLMVIPGPAALEGRFKKFWSDLAESGAEVEVEVATSRLREAGMLPAVEGER